jgi:hypothetical protein
MEIIGFCGRAGTGKNTAATIMSEILGNAGISSAHISFAYPLKKIATEIFAIPEEFVFGDSKNRKIKIGCWEDYFDKTIPNNILKSDNISVRQFLTHLGGDVFRKMIDENFWVKSFKNRIDKKSYDLVFKHDTDVKVVLVTDVRYQNEVEVIKAIGGRTIKLERISLKHAHESEDCVDNIPEDMFYKVFDHEEISTLKDLKAKILTVLNDMELI